MIIKVNKNYRYYVLIGIIIVLDLKMFNLLDVSKFTLFGVSYVDMVFIFNILIFFISLLKYKIIFIKEKYFKILVLSFFMCTIASLIGMYTYNQSFFQGMASQREWLAYILLLYPMHSWIKNKKIDFCGLRKLLMLLCSIYALICIFQFLIYDHIVFTYVTSNQRYGSLRLYFVTIYFSLLSGIIIDKIYDYQKKNLFIEIVMLISFLFIIIVITKGRMMTLSLLMAMYTCAILKNNLGLIKKFFLIIACLVIVIIFTNSTMGKDIINTLDGNSENDTLSVRNAGRHYYLNLMAESNVTLLFGYGSPNIHSSEAQRITNPLWKSVGTARFYLIDQGIIGNYFVYGVVGIVVYLYVMIYSLKNAIYIYIQSGKIAYLQFIIADIIASISLTPSFFRTSFIFVLFLSFIWLEIQSCNEERRKNNENISCESTRK